MNGCSTTQALRRRRGGGRTRRLLAQARSPAKSLIAAPLLGKPADAPFIRKASQECVRVVIGSSIEDAGKKPLNMMECVDNKHFIVAAVREKWNEATLFL